MLIVVDEAGLALSMTLLFGWRIFHSQVKRENDVDFMRKFEDFGKY